MLSKKHFFKTFMISCLILISIFTFNSFNKDNSAQAATKQIIRINYVPNYGIAVWDNYDNGHVTGQYLANNSRWVVIKTVKDAEGNTWYDLGNNQWIMAKYTVDESSVSQAANDAETEAKNWIAWRESRGSYTARNGQCIGKYQLLAAYLHGDFSPRNQELVANNYVYGRYGSWVNAKQFWINHGWY
ncbi:MAG: peptidoglycan-binding protein LysM [Lactobacillus iners]|jgi:hypothetical protein|uniref:aggregation-promoting factor C-terminal-like domain-containing protein n=1 Tax=Lactobacillus iners TaxID=147802 RepID=UPI0001E5D66B|nr:hypothetical protein [Lactobacillus iners]EFO68198.1 hypothetical protein HMPREF9213_0122 [Lactobacillus iners LactinV 09V1-c]MCT7682278.1 peptidoglycan-binding protein LysM [Lactobacillus iners]MCT7735616.1 peptidoglycan-binding protein LysM [Lactobacillus iners]MCT7771384.1 peptidoglycan-binding protein LysM [Lactobacillus iners]MCT7778834.1 peptidoglycan-binding protein LysM [Lactobacillus iners]